MPKILVLLGNENDPNGKLTDVAESRANYTIDFFNKQKDKENYKVIPTGAFGENFNRSSTPHGQLLTEHLSKHIPREQILPFTRTSNTVEDAYGVLWAINEMSEIEEIHVITSTFHMNRVQYIFGRVLQGYKLQYHNVPNPLTHDKKKDKEEKRKLDKLKKEWVDIANFDLKIFPDKCYENLGNELRHYDNFSYLALAGAFISFAYSLSNSVPKLYMCVQYLAGIFMVLTFGYLYARLANTAASARRVMQTIEKLYRLPGLSSTKLVAPLGLNLKIKSAIYISMGVLIALLIIAMIR